MTIPDSSWTSACAAREAAGKKVWNPIEVLNILNPDRRGALTCVGYAPSCGRRCRNSIDLYDRSAAFHLLNQLAYCQPTITGNLRGKLRHLAGHTLCFRYHQDQVEDMVGGWERKISAAYPSQVKIEGGAKSAWVETPDRGSVMTPHGKGQLSEDVVAYLVEQHSKSSERADSQKQSPAWYCVYEKSSGAQREKTMDEMREKLREFRELIEREENERLLREKHDRKQKERGEIERLEREKRERQQREHEENERKETEKREQERRNREEAERRERRTRERFRRARAAREKRELQAREQAEREQKLWESAWDRYEKSWSELKSKDHTDETANETTDVALDKIIPWPTRSGKSHDVTETAVKEFYSKALPQTDSVPEKIKILKDEIMKWHEDRIRRLFGRSERLDSEVLQLCKLVAQVVIRLRAIACEEKSSKC